MNEKILRALVEAGAVKKIKITEHINKERSTISSREREKERGCVRV